jgi:hypothetical protein
LTLKTHKDGSKLGHRFERAQLGEAPFRFLCLEEKFIDNGDGTTQAAGTCHFCGTGIRFCFWIESADGKKFYVGSDCVGHLNDAKLVAVVESAERRRKNALARERAEKKRRAQAEADAREVESRLPEYADALAALESRPHPNPYFAGQGKTHADYFRYFESTSGVPSLYKLKEAVKTAADLKGA